MTSGMTSGCGNARDQLGRLILNVRWLPLVVASEPRRAFGWTSAASEIMSKLSVAIVVSWLVGVACGFGLALMLDPVSHKDAAKFMDGKPT